MANMVADLRRPASSHPSRDRRSRLLVGYGAIAFAAPYLALKIAWLAGSSIGVANEAMMRDPSMVALNVATAAMDVVAIVLALSFTHDWGLCIPAWLVLPPMWVATGLLGRFVAVVPLAAIARMLLTESARPSAPSITGPVQPWVYTAVYAGFTGMGIGLMVAFVLYARARWTSVFGSGPGADAHSASHAVQAPLAVAGAVMALAVGALHLAWALGATTGVAADLAVRRTSSAYVLNAVDAAFAGAAAAGILMIVGRIGHRVAVWLPVTLAWVGSGSLFGWGLWSLVNVLGNTALVRDQAAQMPLVNVASLVRLTAGIVIGIVLLSALAERTQRACTPSARS